MIEVGVRELKRQMRAIRFSLESKLGSSIPNDHAILAWLPSFAAQAINIFRADASGKTPYEREFGRKWNRPALEFGELVYIREAEERTGKKDWQERLTKARFVGHHSRTNAVLGLAADGLHVGSAVKRLSEDDRWSRDGLEDIGALPWDLKSRASQDAGTRLVEQAEKRVRLPPPLPETPDARAFYVTKKDISDHGYTAGCRGCDAVRAGRTPVAHSEAFRKRIIGLVDESRVKKHAETVQSRYELREEHEAKKAKLEDAAKSESRAASEPQAIESSPAAMSPTFIVFTEEMENRGAHEVQERG